MKLQHALEYANDGFLRSRNKLSRIFIEPPDESNSTSEDSDDDICQTTLNFDCDVVLRNGKRLKLGKQQSSPEKWSRCFEKSSKNIEHQSQCAKRDSSNKCVTEDNSVNSSDEIKKQCRKRKLLKDIHTNHVTKKKCETNFNCASEPNLPKKENETKQKLSTKKVTDDLVWIDDVSKPMEAIFPVPNYTDCNELAAYEQFEKY